MFVYREDEEYDAAMDKKARTMMLRQLWVVVIALSKCSGDGTSS